MSYEEGANLLTNLRLNAIPPYRLHTHPVEFTIHTFGVDCEARVKSDTMDTRRAMSDLGMPRVQEIANTIYLHPTLGEDALNAMLDGKRVVINVQRHPKTETKPAMQAVPMAPVEVIASVLDDVPEDKSKKKVENKSRRKQQPAVSAELLH